MPNPPSTPPPSPLAVALLCRCPRCGKGHLYRGAFTLTPRASCEACGLDYAFVDSGDGPAVFAIFLLGFLALGGALVAEFKFGAPVWVHVLLWGLLLPLFALWLLRTLKAVLTAQQWKHQAGEGRLG